MTEAQERLAVVREALTWEGTPYVSNADVKGAGVDCGMLLVRVFVDTGLVEPFDPRPYPPQWHLHQKAEKYLGIVLRFAHEVETPLPGDLVLCRFGNCFAHGAIVLDWPEVIHANGPRLCLRDSFARNALLQRLDRKFFSIWPRESLR